MKIIGVGIDIVESFRVEKSLKNKIDTKITHKIWKNMIVAYIDFERRNFKKK